MFHMFQMKQKKQKSINQLNSIYLSEYSVSIYWPLDFYTVCLYFWHVCSSVDTEPQADQRWHPSSCQHANDLAWVFDL